MKPLGRRCYGSIGHLPNSRLGPSDRSVPEGQARICCEKTRDKFDKVFVQTKLDGSCCGVALLDGKLVPLVRSGYSAVSSKYEQHQLFDQWVWAHQDRFYAVLNEGERLVGEWLAQAHGTIYNLTDREPFAPFDIIRGTTRLPTSTFLGRVSNYFYTPTLLHAGESLPVEDALVLHKHDRSWPCDELEGIVYRVERKGIVDFLAKYVVPTKIDGKYLPEISGEPAIWNWRPGQ